MNLFVYIGLMVQNINKMYSEKQNPGTGICIFNLMDMAIYSVCLFIQLSTQYIIRSSYLFQRDR